MRLSIGAVETKKVLDPDGNVVTVGCYKAMVVRSRSSGTNKSNMKITKGLTNQSYTSLSGLPIGRGRRPEIRAPSVVVSGRGGLTATAPRSTGDVAVRP